MLNVAVGRPTEVIVRWRKLATAFAVSMVAVGFAASPAAAYEVIETTGPIEEITLGDDLSCQVKYVNDVDLEFYPPDTTPGDCATILATGGNLYAPEFESHGRTATWGLGSYYTFTPVSQTGVMGAGTAADPYRVTTVVEAAGSELLISETTSYVSGSNTYRIDTAVTNRGHSQVSVNLYHAGDCYASGSDIGFGFTRTEVGSAGCSQTAQNSPAARTIQMAPLSATSRYFEAKYNEVWERIATQNPFPNTCRCGEHIDNGVGLSWSFSLLPLSGSTVRSLAVAFTESTPPAPGADTDGDALPDRWETGNGASGDYENLAPLGADPNRKDVFVHLDYMDGCKPPAGWEKPAIQVFAKHGIALHVDSGPDSINADGQPWGSRSRAGAIPKQDNIDLWGAFDALKDTNFVPSNRRRAFHYAALVNEFDHGDGGLARNIPEADFLFSACSVPSWLKIGLKRYVTAVFVHELGHNLGLRHGGDEDMNGKPNYYGIMNYYWTYRGGVGETPNVAEPEYSRSTRPEIDERRVDERVPQVLPVAWNCPGSKPQEIEYELGRGTSTIDWDCDGIRDEPPYRTNLNSSFGLGETVIKGFNDWAPGVMKFNGGGVLGNFDLPERPSTPVTHELTIEEFAAAQKARERSRREARKQLVVETRRRRLKAGGTVTLRLRVTTEAKGKRVRGARIKLSGATPIGRNPKTTDRHGSITLKLRPKRRGYVQIFATRHGFTRGGLVLAVRRSAKHPKAPSGKKSS